MDSRILEFANRHKSAQEVGLDGLYRFLSFSSDEKTIDKHEAMLTNGWLYHTTRECLNDPHDLSFKFKWPELGNTEEIEGLIEDLKVLLSLMGDLPIKNGLTIQSLLEDKSLRRNIEEGLISYYAQTRICCFTTSHIKPLFWAHYANSHQGYCVKFKANDNPKSVFANSRRIYYSNDYPTIKFPIVTNLVSALSVILHKSEEWQYEGEYRSLFSPDWPYQLENNGSALSLHCDEISDIYFGMHMLGHHKDKIIQLATAGPFNPRFWNTTASKEGFDLDFTEYKS